SAPAAANSAAPPAKKPSFGARVAGFFRRLFGGKPKTEQQSALKEALPEWKSVPASARSLCHAKACFEVFHPREGRPA
ncbi:MAG TPA: hypothetical protein VJX29_00315, partial [Candidatus Acidoferrales bacterium]|nr:hypothetical protein [Candidatus Acidoferrales bacterium]